MDIIDDSNEVTNKVIINSEFSKFISESQKGIRIVNKEYFGTTEVVAKPDTGDFIKWIKSNKPSINLHLPSSTRQLVLKSNDFWLPLVYLCNDVTLQMYLNIVASYLYDRSKGLLKGERTRVHFKAIHQDPDGRIKEFSFEGDSETLEKTIKKFDINRFMEN